MTSQELLVLYRDKHAAELGRRRDLDARLQIPIGLCTAVGGAIIASLLNPPRPEGSGVAVAATVTFFFIASIAASLLSLAILHLARSWWGQTYAYIASARQLESYREDME